MGIMMLRSRVMKWIVLITVFVLMAGFLGCSSVSVKEDFFDYPETFDTIYEAIRWTFENVKYDINSDIWQLPSTTYAMRLGDCEDRVILSMHFLRDMGHDVRLVAVQIEESGSGHAIIRVDGLTYENNGRSVILPEEVGPVTRICYTNVIVLYEITYEEALSRCNKVRWRLIG